jgi:hypothetical protein
VLWKRTLEQAPLEKTHDLRFEGQQGTGGGHEGHEQSSCDSHRQMRPKKNFSEHVRITPGDDWRQRETKYRRQILSLAFWRERTG